MPDRARGAPFGPLARTPLFALALVAGLVHDALAFEIETTPAGAPLRWRTPSIPFDVVFRLDDAHGETLSTAARAAFDTWARASRGRIRPLYLPPAGGMSRMDGRTTIAELSPWEDDLGERDRTIARTLLVYDPITGEIGEADIILNTESFAFDTSGSGAFDPESVLLHEVGHALGFAHSCGNSGSTYPSCFQIPDEPPGNAARILEAVMAPTLAPGVELRDLGADDLAALALHYAASSTVVAPRIDGVVRACPEGDLEVIGEGFPSGAIVEVRHASGRIGLLAITVRSPGALRIATVEATEDEDLDLILRDPSTGAYDSIVRFTPPPACQDASGGGTPEVVPGGGCDCGMMAHDGALGRQPRLELATIVMIAILGTVLRRSRRPHEIMRRRVRTHRFLPLVAGLVMCSSLLARATEVHAFKCSRVGADFGPSLIWERRVIPWAVDAALTADISDHDLALAEVIGSYKTWEDVDCSDLELPFAGEEEHLLAGFDAAGPNKNIVVFVASGWPYDPGVIAVTTNAYDTRTGIVIDSDIEMNDENFLFVIVDETCEARTGVMDLRNALTHEVGHLIGLDHPPNTQRNAESTMFASAPPCETKKRTLAQDDVDGVCSIYPLGMVSEQCFPPDGPSFAVVEMDDGFGGCSHTKPAARSWRTPASLVCLLLFALGLGIRERDGRPARARGSLPHRTSVFIERDRMDQA